jgi:thiamine-phosphate pyrophosphorylase
MTIIERFINAKLYTITCPPKNESEGYEAMVRAACEGGADIIQFRDKLITGRDRYAMAARLLKICRASNVLFIVNDAIEVALAVAADGVHLGQDDLPVAEAKKLMHPMGIKNFLVGCSTHSLEQALEAERQGADYIGIGPVFATPTKPTYNPLGLELVRRVTSCVKTPHVAIGGIDATNAAEVLAAGAERVAVVRAVCGAGDIAAAAKKMKETIAKSLPPLWGKARMGGQDVDNATPTSILPHQGGGR